MLLVGISGWSNVHADYATAMLPLVFPGIVMGIAILKMYLSLPVPVYGTIWILVLAFIARYLPYGIRFSHSRWFLVYIICRYG